MIWFNAGGKGEGDNQDPSLQFSLLQYATSLFTPFIFMPYTAMIIWGCKMLNCSFFGQAVCNSYPTCCNFGPCKRNSQTASYPQDVCKLSERACNANIWRQNKLRAIQILPEMRNLSAYAFADGYFYTTTPTLILLLRQ